MIFTAANCERTRQQDHKQKDATFSVQRLAVHTYRKSRHRNGRANVGLRLQRQHVAPGRWVYGDRCGGREQRRYRIQTSEMVTNGGTRDIDGCVAGSRRTVPERAAITYPPTAINASVARKQR